MSLSSKSPLRILVTPLNSHGHINACHGLCEELRDRGHEVIFLLDSDYAGRLAKYGFKERLIERPPMVSDEEEEEMLDENGQKMEFWQAFMIRNADVFSQPPLEQIRRLIPKNFGIMFEAQNAIADQYEQAINELKPDLIIHDGYICFPTVVNSKVPWIWMYSAAPHQMLNDPRIPPYFSGFPLDSDRSKWDEFRLETEKSLADLARKIDECNVAHGGKPLNGRVHPMSKYLNLYMWPRELRYPEIEHPEHILPVECFVRTMPDQKFEIPEQLQDLPGRLIFFSMGSFGCCNLGMMKRLVSMLAKSPHRFIVAKGPLNYDLPGENMYGEAFLPQTAVLQIVDLVITHGGNNTVTETFYYGKPMLVLPNFCDQHDNAQRIEEVGLGAKLNPFECTEEELLGTIDRLVSDQELAERMRKIGERIRNSRDKQIVADRIEKLFLNAANSKED